MSLSSLKNEDNENSGSHFTLIEGNEDNLFKSRLKENSEWITAALRPKNVVHYVHGSSNTKILPLKNVKIKRWKDLQKVPWKLVIIAPRKIMRRWVTNLKEPSQAESKKSFSGPLKDDPGILKNIIGGKPYMFIPTNRATGLVGSGPKILPNYFIGYSPLVTGNGVFYDSNSLVYAYGNLLIRYFLETGIPKIFVNLDQDDDYIKCFRFSRDKTHIIIGMAGGSVPYAHVLQKMPEIREEYDIYYKKQKIEVPTNGEGTIYFADLSCYHTYCGLVVGNLQFSEFLYVCHIASRRPVFTFNFTHYFGLRISLIGGVIFHPKIENLFVVYGEGLIRMIHFRQFFKFGEWWTQWRHHGFHNGENLFVTNALWFDEDTLILSTDTGKLLILVHGRLVGVYDTPIRNVILPSKKVEGWFTGGPYSWTSISKDYKRLSYDSRMKSHIRALQMYGHDGFLYARDGNIYVYQLYRDKEFKRKIRRFRWLDTFTINGTDQSFFDKQCYNIRSVYMCPMKELMSVATGCRTIFIFNIKIQDRYLPKALENMTFHCQGVSSVASAKYNPNVFTLGDRQLMMWHQETLKVVGKFKIKKPAHSVAFHPFGNMLLLAGEKLRIYDLYTDPKNKRTEMMRKVTYDIEFKFVEYSESGSLFLGVTNNPNGFVYIFHSTSFKPIKFYSSKKEAIRAHVDDINFSVLISARFGIAMKYNLHTDEQIIFHISPSNYASNTDITEDVKGGNVYHVNEDSCITRINYTNNETLHHARFYLMQDELNCIKFLKCADAILASGSKGSLVALWTYALDYLCTKFPRKDEREFIVSYEVNSHFHPVTELHILDTNRIITGCSDGSICLYEVPSVYQKPRDYSKDSAYGDIKGGLNTGNNKFYSIKKALNFWNTNRKHYFQWAYFYNLAIELELTLPILYGITLDGINKALEYTSHWNKHYHKRCLKIFNTWFDYINSLKYRNLTVVNKQLIDNIRYDGWMKYKYSLYGHRKILKTYKNAMVDFCEEFLEDVELPDVHDDPSIDPLFYVPAVTNEYDKMDLAGDNIKAGINLWLPVCGLIYVLDFLEEMNNVYSAQKYERGPEREKPWECVVRPFIPYMHKIKRLIEAHSFENNKDFVNYCRQTNIFGSNMMMGDPSSKEVYNLIGQMAKGGNMDKEWMRDLIVGMSTLSYISSTCDKYRFATNTLNYAFRDLRTGDETSHQQGVAAIRERQRHYPLPLRICHGIHFRGKDKIKKAAKVQAYNKNQTWWVKNKVTFDYIDNRLEGWINIIRNKFGALHSKIDKMNSRQIWDYLWEIERKLEKAPLHPEVDEQTMHYKHKRELRTMNEGIDRYLLANSPENHEIPFVANRGYKNVWKTKVAMTEEKERDLYKLNDLKFIEKLDEEFKKGIDKSFRKYLPTLWARIKENQKKYEDLKQKVDGAVDDIIPILELIKTPINKVQLQTKQINTTQGQINPENQIPRQNHGQMLSKTPNLKQTQGKAHLQKDTSKKTQANILNQTQTQTPPEYIMPYRTKTELITKSKPEHNALDNTNAKLRTKYKTKNTCNFIEQSLLSTSESQLQLKPCTKSSIYNHLKPTRTVQITSGSEASSDLQLQESGSIQTKFKLPMSPKLEGPGNKKNLRFSSRIRNTENHSQQYTIEIRNKSKNTLPLLTTKKINPLRTEQKIATKINSNPRIKIGQRIFYNSQNSSVNNVNNLFSDGILIPWKQKMKYCTNSHEKDIHQAFGERAYRHKSPGLNCKYVQKNDIFCLKEEHIRVKSD